MCLLLGSFDFPLVPHSLFPPKLLGGYFLGYLVVIAYVFTQNSNVIINIAEKTGFPKPMAKHWLPALHFTVGIVVRFFILTSLHFISTLWMLNLYIAFASFSPLLCMYVSFHFFSTCCTEGKLSKKIYFLTGI